MWDQWIHYTQAPPLPTSAPPPPPQEPNSGTTASTTPVVIGPMLPPSAVTSATAAPMTVTAAQTASTTSVGATQAISGVSVNPYSQYTAAQYAAMTPEQQYALQQHWQQWQKYQEEYARWHAQYGEQYKREMELAGAAASTTTATQVYTSYYQQPPPTPTPAQTSGKITGQPQLYTQPPPSQNTSTQPAQTTQMNYTTSVPTAVTQQPPPWQHHLPPFNQPPPNFNQYNTNANNSQMNLQYQQTQWSRPPGIPQGPGGVGVLPPQQQQQQIAIPENSWQGPPNINRGGIGPDNWNNNPGNRGNNWNNNNQNVSDNNCPPKNWNRGNNQNSMESAVLENKSIENVDHENKMNISSNDRNVGPNNQCSNNWKDGSGQNDHNFSTNNRGPNNWNDGPNNRGFNNWNDGPNNRGNNGSNDWNDGPINRGFNDRNLNSNNRGGNNWNDGQNNRGSNNWNDGPKNRGSNNWNDGPNSRGPNNWSDRGANKAPNDNSGPDNRGTNDCNIGPNNVNCPSDWDNRDNKGPVNSSDNTPNNRARTDGPPQKGNSGPGATDHRYRISDLDDEMFDRQFRQWEQQFEDWKKANANHPDKEMYKRYEQEFENQRKRISERREQMRRRKLEQMGLDPNQPPKKLANRPPTQEVADENSFGRKSNDSTGSQQSTTSKKNQNKKQFDNNSTKSNVSKQQPGTSKQDVETDTQVKCKDNSPVQNPNEDVKTSNDDTNTTAMNRESQQQNKNMVTPQEKRKSRFDSPVKSNKKKNLEGEGAEVINLDDEVDHEESKEKEDNISEIFKKVDDIPGLDLADEYSLSTDVAKDKKSSNPEYNKLSNQKLGQYQADVKNPKKIPSLFDIKVDKPLLTDDDTKQQQLSTSSVPNAIPDLAKSLNDPDFLKKISEAVAHVKVGDQLKIQDGDGRQLSFAEWQKRIQCDGSESKLGDSNMGFDNTNSRDSFRASNRSEAEDDIGSNFSGNSNGSKRIRDMPNNIGPNKNMFYNNNYGPNNNFGPNRPNNWGPNGPNNWGPNIWGPDFSDPNGRNNWGPNGPNWGPNGGPNNWGPNDGPNNWGSNKCNNFGPNGPNNWGPNGPNNPNGPNGPNNWGPNGPNNWGPNIWGPSCGSNWNIPDSFKNNNNSGELYNRGGNNFGFNRNNFGPNGPGRNFGNDGNNYGPNFGPNDGFGRNFGRNGNNDGSGRNFGRDGPGRNFGPNDGPGRNFGRDGSNFSPNDGSSRNLGPNDGPGCNFGPNDGPGPNFGPIDRPGRNFGCNDGFGRNYRDGPNLGPNSKDGNRRNGSRDGSRDRSKDRRNDSNDRRDNSNSIRSSSKDGSHSDDSGAPTRNINNPFRRNDIPSKIPSLEGDDGFKSKNQTGSWNKGPDGRTDNLDYGDYYRPAQVIDYSNINATPTTTITPKVIDYGHKPVMSDFKPLKIINYDHASKARNQQQRQTEQQQTGLTASQKRKNKRKNKNKFQSQEQQQKQNQNNKQLEAPQNPANNRIIQKDLQEQNKTAGTTTIEQDVLEEISDTEDIPDEPESPPPPPPPLFNSCGTFMELVPQDTPSSIFPSTADANENLPKVSSAHVQISIPTEENNNTVSIDEILLKPGRQTRPKKICVILRGPPGSGKSYVAKLIKEKEKEMGGNNLRVLSIDDYFLIENDYEEKCPKTGKKIPKKEILYEYDKDMEDKYMECLIKSFKKTVADNLYDFIVIDCNNNSLRSLNEFYCHSKDSGYMPYIIDLVCDLETCLSHNVHDRREKDIKEIIDTWKPTPGHYIKLDISSLLQNIVEMEDAEDMAVDDRAVNESDDTNMKEITVVDLNNESDNDNEKEECDDNDEDDSNDSIAKCGFLKSKWETDTTTQNLARLDGTSKLATKCKPTMEEYLQMDEWQPRENTKGKKRVRWADIEEKREQEKMRAVGFVVGQTDWKRMMDPNAAKRALNKTKYIERVNKKKC